MSSKSRSYYYRNPNIVHIVAYVDVGYDPDLSTKVSLKVSLVVSISSTNSELYHMLGEKLREQDILVSDSQIEISRENGVLIPNDDSRQMDELRSMTTAVLYVTLKGARSVTVSYFSPGWGSYELEFGKLLVKSQDIYQTLAEMVGVPAFRLNIAETISDILPHEGVEVKVTTLPQRILFVVSPE